MHKVIYTCLALIGLLLVLISIATPGPTMGPDSMDFTAWFFLCGSALMFPFGIIALLKWGEYQDVH